MSMGTGISTDTCKSEGVGLRLYRWVFRSPLRFLAKRLELGGAGRWKAHAQLPSKASESKNPVLWFHAASAGELESLWEVILSWVSEGGEIYLSVFSESAIARAELIAQEIEKSGKSGALHGWGYSPLEGEWAARINDVRPAAFVTSKYEAWPELWAALSMAKIPLVIVGAMDRSSLRLAKKILAWLRIELPKMALLCSRDEDRASLLLRFPRAKVTVTGDPRWDRVASRAKKGNARAAELLQVAQVLPRPWGVLGSTWASDLKVWDKLLNQVPGTLWIVPHHTHERSLKEQEEILAHLGISWVRTSTKTGFAEGVKAVLVNESGFLSELYAGADWAYVGGGFGAGVHSTIEPAIRGLPISCGPSRSDRFPEIDDLSKQGQLQKVSNHKDLEAWVSGLPGRFSKRAMWKDEAANRTGSSGRAIREIRELLQAELSERDQDARLEPSDPKRGA